MKFDELNIDERILRAIEDMGFEETSPIQTQAIPAVCEGIDVAYEDRPTDKKASGNRTLPYKRACCTGG